MLGKIMKYEWRACGKLLAICCGYLLGVGILWIIAGLLDSSTDGSGAFMASVLFAMMYFLGAFAIMIGTTIYLIARFYRTVYGDEGYLLHTLPVGKHSIIWGKILMAYVFFLLEGCAFVLVVGLKLRVVAGTGEDFSNWFADIINLWNYIRFQFAGEQISQVVLSIASILLPLTSVLALMLRITAALSLGQLSVKNRMMSAVGWYFLIGIVCRIISLFGKGTTSFSGIVFGAWLLANSPEQLALQCLANLVYSAAFYVITWMLMQRKLNLE